MEAKELRIGNYINYNFDNVVYNKGILRVDCDVFTHIKKDGGMLAISPIVLTEELLLKFGFIKSGTNTDTHWLKCDNEGVSRIGLKQYKELFNNNHISFDFNVGGAYSTSSVDIKIEFVHQLQNLYFALTTEELILNE